MKPTEDVASQEPAAEQERRVLLVDGELVEFWIEDGRLLGRSLGRPSDGVVVSA